MKKSIFSLLFSILVFTNIAEAATIHGTIYDLSLKKIDNARVEINTTPRQLKIAQNGTYSFNVPNGVYRIKAQLVQKNDVIASVEENITIAQDGIYVLDMILFPDVEEGVEDPEIEINGSVVDESNSNRIFLIGFIIMFISGIAVGIAYFLKTRKKYDGENAQQIQEKESEDIGQVMKVIRQEGGRTTQKEIRKQIPLSEAKISLMIAELEHKGIVEKIKKGRGNIIILKKR